MYWGTEKSELSTYKSTQTLWIKFFFKKKENEENKRTIFYYK